MMNKKLTTTFLFCLIGMQFVTSQNAIDTTSVQYKDDWVIGLGFNAVNDSGKGAKDFFNVRDNWNFGIPFYVSVENYLNNQFSVGANLSFNKIREGKLLDGQTILAGGNEAGYAAIDLAVKYSFRDVFKLKSLEPYVFLGAGVTYIGDYQTEQNNDIIKGISRLTINTGIGCNYWFSSTWGVNLNLAGKFGVGKNVTNQVQSSLGVLFHFKNKKSSSDKTIINNYKI